MAVPYTFGSATSSIPLSQLDNNFATAITLGTTNVYLGNTTTTLNGLTLSNVTISSGNVTITSVTLTNANITGTTTLSNLTASTALALDSSKNIVSVTNTGTGNNVLAASPSLTGTVTIATLNLTNALGTTYGGTGLTSFTANGVVYASSTSALATGSALTFDGTTFVAKSNAEFGNSLVDANRYVNIIGAGGNKDYGIQLSGSRVLWQNTGQSGLLFGVSDTEQMRLNSTGLGIGTSSPATKLDVYNSAASGISEIARFRWNNGGTGGAITWANQAGTVLGQIANVTDSGGIALSFYNYNSGTALGERMRLDSSGNLGLGVTPSAWSGYKAFEIGNAGSAVWSSGLTDIRLAANMYYNAGYKYAGTGVASRFELSSGGFYWYQAPSGTAGNAITFTQAMTLDASGQLQLGTTSANGILTVAKNAGKATFDSLGGYFTIELASSGTRKAFFGYNEGTAQWQLNNVASGGAEQSVLLYDRTSAYLSFGTNGSERARIDSSGNLLVGTTSVGPVNANAITIEPANSRIRVGHASTANGTPYMQFDYNGSNIGSITQSTTTSVLYNVTSDQRLKENIVDSPEFGSVIDSIKVRSYDWKENNSHQRAGFIAQELVTVAPEAVHQPADAEEMMAVDYSKLVPMLVKEIQSLRKRLADAGIA